MDLDSVFSFFINIISQVFIWFYDLSVPLYGDISIPLGDLLISIVILAVIIKIFFYFNDFTSVFIHRDEEGRQTGRTIVHGGKARHINYYDNGGV